MRSYYFHLEFELCATKHKELSIENPPTLLDSHSWDIFREDLPQDSVVAWGDSFDTDGIECFKDSAEGARQQDTASDDPDLYRSIKELKVSKESATNVKDWRLDDISVISIDMASSNEGRPPLGRGKSVGQDKPADILPGSIATKGKYVPSNPSNTELGWGVVHLYRDVDETPGLYEDGDGSSSITNTAAFDANTCLTLCILAVPSYMSPSDLLGFVGERTREEVTHFRLIRTGRTNKYMVLMKFREASNAKRWQSSWNGKPFNSMEPEYCHVVFVQSIAFQISDHTDKPTSFPNMNNDPFLPAVQPSTVATTDATKSSSLSTKPMAPPTPALIELPTCPVCLERMDETTGLLIILCQHVFHCACLEKWRGTGCPVCRYTQSNGLPGRGGPLSGDGSTMCSICQAEQNLWICLICGNIGCGRYDSAHAFAHWEETNHAYAMDISTQHVWDYAGDGYVHRLIQNKADGKLMDLPAASQGGKLIEHGMSAFGADTVPREKMEAMGNEYAYLLTSQLDSQRLYYEEQLDRAVDKASKAATAVEQSNGTLQTVLKRLDDLQRSHEELHFQLKALEKEATRAKTRGEKSDALARKLGNDWKEEKTVNDSLLERIKYLDQCIAEEQAKRTKLEAEKADLEDQNRDLTFFISSGDKLKQAGEDVVQGTVEVPMPVPESSSSGKKPRRKRK